MTYRIIDKDFLQANLDEFLSIDRDFPGGSWSAANFLAELPRKWELSIALVIENTMAGFIIASKKEDAVHIHRFTLRTDSRSRGFGEQLLREFAHHCKRLNEFSISLKVASDNLQAISFYKKHLFKEVSPLEKNILMTKELKKIVAIHQP